MTHPPRADQVRAHRRHRGGGNCGLHQCEPGSLRGSNHYHRPPTGGVEALAEMRAALEAVAPLIAAKAWEEGYTEGSRGRMCHTGASAAINDLL